MAQVKLLPIEKSDLPLLQHWRNSDQVLPWCRQYRALSMQDMEKWYTLLSKDPDFNLSNDLHIIEHNGTKVGVGGLVRIDWRNAKAEVSFYVGERISENAVSECLALIIRYSFATLNLHKIYFPCYQGNPYLAIYEQVMEVEYIARREYYWDNNYLDRIVLVAYREDYNEKV